MTYKKDAAKAHASKLKGYADGGGITPDDALLGMISQEAQRRLAGQLASEEDFDDEDTELEPPEPVEDEPEVGELG